MATLIIWLFVKPIVLPPLPMERRLVPEAIGVLPRPQLPVEVWLLALIRPWSAIRKATIGMVLLAIITAVQNVLRCPKDPVVPVRLSGSIIVRLLLLMLMIRLKIPDS